MVDIVYTLKAIFRRNTVAVLGKGDAGNAKVVAASKSVTARADGDTMKMIRVPSTARLASSSFIHWDDLDSAGAPTMDVGVAPVDSNFVADPDALLAGLDITAAGSNVLISNHANYGKPLWEQAGLATDPGGQIDIFVSFVDATTNITGDVTLEITYTLD